MSHHIHVDTDDQGYLVGHCLKCQASVHQGIPPEPCSQPDVAVLCCAEDTGIRFKGGGR